MDAITDGDADMGNRNDAQTEEIIELRSLGIDSRRKNALNDKEELNALSDIIKQSMYQDYKLAYSKKGEKYKEESKSTAGR